MTTKVLNTLKRALDALEASLPRTRASATQRQEIQEARELLEKLEAAVSAKATPRPSAKVPELEYGLPPSAADGAPSRDWIDKARKRATGAYDLRKDSLAVSLMRDAIRTAGSFDPAELMFYIEEHLTEVQHDEIVSFLAWCHDTGTSFGAATFARVYATFREERQRASR